MDRSENKEGQILQSCLEKIETGQETLDSVLAKYPEIAEELRPQLKMAMWLMDAKSAFEPRPGFIDASRQRLIERIQQESPRAAPGTSLPFSRRVIQPAQPRRQFFQRIFTFQFAVALLLVIVLAAASTGIVQAAQNTIPGDSLYPVKMAQENIQLALAPNTAASARYHAKFAQRRLVEIQNLILENRAQYLPNTIEDYREQVNRANSDLSTLSKNDPILAKNLASNLKESITSQTTVILSLNKVASDQARQDINQTLNVSSAAVSTAQAIINAPTTPTPASPTLTPFQPALQTEPASEAPVSGPSTQAPNTQTPVPPTPTGSPATSAVPSQPPALVPLPGSTSIPAPSNTPGPAASNTPAPAASITPVPPATQTPPPANPILNPSPVPSNTPGPAGPVATPAQGSKPTKAPTPTDTPTPPNLGPVSTPTDAPKPTKEPKPTKAPTPTDTPTPPNLGPVSTPTDVPKPTKEPKPTKAAASTQTATLTSVPMNISPPSPTPTLIPSSTPTQMLMPTDTPIPTDIFTPADTPASISIDPSTPTDTPVPTDIFTPADTPAAISIDPSTPTDTPVPMDTLSPTDTPAAMSIDPSTPTDTPVPAEDIDTPFVPDIETPVVTATLVPISTAAPAQELFRNTTPGSSPAHPAGVHAMPETPAAASKSNPIHTTQPPKS